MTRRSFGYQVLSQALEKVRLAWGRGNEEQAIAAVQYAFRQRPNETLLDDDGIGFLGLDDFACTLLDEAGFVSIGDLRGAGLDGLASKLRSQHSPERLAAYAKGRKWPAGTASDVAKRLAREVRIAMASFNVRLTYRGAKR